MVRIMALALFGSAVPLRVRADWPADATQNVPICTASGKQEDPAIVSDGNGGAIIAWRDQRNDKNDDIYAQRVDSAGTVCWPENGVPIDTAADANRASPSMVSDGQGGAIIAWRVWSNHHGWDVYAQRVDAAGVKLWPADGLAVCLE